MSHVYMMWKPSSNPLGEVDMKIGRSDDPMRRICEMEIASPERFMAHTWKVNDAKLVEEFTHLALQKYRTRGEWFLLPLDMRHKTIMFMNNLSLYCGCRTCDGFFSYERSKQEKVIA